MSEPLRRAKSYRDLLQLQDDGGPYVWSEIFSDESFRARLQSRRNLRLLKRIDAALRPVLHEGERVYYVTRGIMVSFLESMFLGWVMYYLNRRAIVVTNRRILLLQVNSRDKPRHLRSQIRYPAIVELKGTVLTNTKLRFRSGKSRLFTRIPRSDRKLLKAVIEQAHEKGVDATSDAADMEDLCPYCYTPVAGRPPACPDCGGRFKSAAKAGWRSLLFPGLGDLYIGHRGFAVLEMAVAAIFWLAVITSVTDPTMQGIDTLLFAVFVVAFVHVPDALGTWYWAGKGIHPVGR